MFFSYKFSISAVLKSYFYIFLFFKLGWSKRCLIVNLSPIIFDFLRKTIQQLLACPLFVGPELLGSVHTVRQIHHQYHLDVSSLYLASSPISSLQGKQSNESFVLLTISSSILYSSFSISIFKIFFDNFYVIQKFLLIQ